MTQLEKTKAASSRYFKGLEYMLRPDIPQSEKERLNGRWRKTLENICPEYDKLNEADGAIFVDWFNEREEEIACEVKRRYGYDRA